MNHTNILEKHRPVRAVWYGRVGSKAQLLKPINVLNKPYVLQKKTLLYIRSNDQKSVNLQKLKGEKYAAQNSLSINIFLDTNTSGLKSLSDRPGMRRIMQLVEVNVIETIIVDTLYRVSREIEQLLYFVEFLRKNNTKLVILNWGTHNAYL